jgi:hypothetical protein
MLKFIAAPGDQPNLSMNQPRKTTRQLDMVFLFPVVWKYDSWAVFPNRTVRESTFSVTIPARLFLAYFLSLQVVLTPRSMRGSREAPPSAFRAGLTS